MDEPHSTFFGRHEFLIRRLHSLSGLLPVGAYMVMHLSVNASVLAGSGTFQDNVDRIHSLGPALPLVEWAFIFLPIIFHAVVGVWIARTGSPNSSVYRYGANWRYTWQRITAWIALVFIFWHVFHMHGWIHNDAWLDRVARPVFGGQFNPEFATSSAALALRPLAAKIAYGVGVLACVYHLANGLWTMGITWGLWVTPAAQRRANYVCATFGALLAIVGMSALFGFSSVNVPQAEALETARIEAREQIQQKADEIYQSEQADAGDADAAIADDAVTAVEPARPVR